MCNFDCSMCAGVCCAVPPAISSEEEIIKAKQLGAEMVAVYLPSDNAYAVSIVKEADECPFLGTNGDCMIYDNRFWACKEFECRLYGSAVPDLLGTLKDMKTPQDAAIIVGGLTKNKKEIRRVLFGREVVETHNIPTVSAEIGIERVNATDPNSFMEKVVKTLHRIIQKGEANVQDCQ